MRHSSWALVIVFGLLPSPVFPQNGAAQAPEKQPSIYDKIWGTFTNWYDDKQNPVIQRVVFSGRYHQDFADIEGDQRDAVEWNVRRVRFGPRITMFRNFTVHTELEVNPQERDPFYVRITDAYVAWSNNPALVVTVGKQAVRFTEEGATSSRELLTIDRSNLANNIWFGQEYLPGISVSGRRQAWTYSGGVHSAGAANREFGQFNGSLLTLAVLGYDFARKLGVKEAVVKANYLYQPPDTDNEFTRRFEHITSVNFRFEQGRWGTRGDVSTTVGYLGQPDVRAFMLMPYFNATGKLQLVGRYTFVESDADNGVTLPTYENRVARGNGDEYREAYAGANYYLYGHRLKLQTGLQFAEMLDRANDGGAYSGISWIIGLRIGW